jgi:hypothetical protein
MSRKGTQSRVSALDLDIHAYRKGIKRDFQFARPNQLLSGAAGSNPGPAPTGRQTARWPELVFAVRHEEHEGTLVSRTETQVRHSAGN